jgi:hypothetical protein
MEFLNPTALYGILALPLLLIPYLIRRKPQRIIFSSLLLLTEYDSSARRRLWGRLRLPPAFFLQLLLLTLLILALAEPVLSVRPTHIAIVLDNSASMQTLENGKTRFALAQERARSLVADLGVNGRVELYRTVPRLEKIRATAFSPSEAAGAIGALEVYDLGDRAIDYDPVLNEMMREQKYERVYLITDHPVSSQGEKIRALSVGSPQANIALLAFQVRRASLANAQLEATVELGNFSAKEEKINVLLRGSGTLLQSRELVVGAGKTAEAGFSGFAAHPYYEVEIDARDALALDNRAFAVARTAATNLRILAVSPRPQALASLGAIPGVKLDVVSPAEYERAERSGYGLEIFHFATPASLPETPALFVLPPDANALVDLGRPIARTVVSRWRDPHPLTRYVNFSLFRPIYARPLKPQVAGDVIIESPQGPLVFAIERRGARHLVLGFDPFPYLGRENLPMSIFTLNFLDWFLESGSRRGTASGEPLVFGVAGQGGLLTTPRGEKISLEPGADNYAETFRQGVYQLKRNGENQLFAVNLQDSNESDLRAPAQIAMKSATLSGGGAAALISYWPYLLLAALLLLIIEWFIFPRMALLRARVRSGRVA